VLPFDSLRSHTLANGEPIHSLNEFIPYFEKSRSPKLIINFKINEDYQQEEDLVHLTVESLKKHNLFNPEKVIFVSFGKHLCDIVATEYPEFVNMYLKSDLAPAVVSHFRINAIAYNQNVMKDNPTWVEEANDYCMMSGVWDITDGESAKYFMEKGVDIITSTNPELVRKILGKKEYR